MKWRINARGGRGPLVRDHAARLIDPFGPGEAGAAEAPLPGSRGQSAPEGGIARVFEFRGDVSGLDQLVVEPGQFPLGHTHVDVVGQVVTDVVRHEEETALSRMVASGELSAVDGSYRLTSRRHLELQARQAASRSAQRRRWLGLWLMAIVVLDRRDAPDRADLRAALESLRMAELREGVWLRPDNLNGTWPEVVEEQCTVMSARDVDPALTDRLWNLAGWSNRAQELRRDLAGLVGPLERGDVSLLAEGFIVSAAVLRHVQNDPLLPDQLLPHDWPGALLRGEYQRFDTAYRAVLREYLRAVR